MRTCTTETFGLANAVIPRLEGGGVVITEPEVNDVASHPAGDTATFVGVEPQAVEKATISVIATNTGDEVSLPIVLA